MLRSQDGVEKVEDPYGNLQKGQVEIKTAKEKAIDLTRLVQVLEKDIGFEPVTRVTMKLNGRLERRGGKLIFSATGTGQSFEVERIEAGGQPPPEQQVITAVATLANPQMGDRIVLREWKVAQEGSPQR